jgi:hypothetical protein
VVPEINRKTWVDLARSASNLNQIAHHLNMTDLKGKRIVNIPQIIDALTDFRNQLIGASNSFAAVEEEEEGEEETE